MDRVVISYIIWMRSLIKLPTTKDRHKLRNNNNSNHHLLFQHPLIKLLEVDESFLPIKCQKNNNNSSNNNNNNNSKKSNHCQCLTLFVTTTINNYKTTEEISLAPKIQLDGIL